MLQVEIDTKRQGERRLLLAEAAVVAQLARVLSSDEIARELGKSLGVVKNQLNSACRNPATMDATNKSVCEMLLCGGQPANPNHHLWLNNGTWFCNYTIYPTPITKERVRFSLKTPCVRTARSRRDVILAKLCGQGMYPSNPVIYCEAAHPGEGLQVAH